MYFASSKGLGKVVVLSCERGDNIFEALNRCLRENKIDNAVVLSGVATFEKLNYHYVENDKFVPEERHVHTTGAFEVANIDGFILHGTPHIHFAACDHGRIVAAHLEPDTTVLYAAELVLAEILELDPYQRIVYPDRVILED